VNAFVPLGVVLFMVGAFLANALWVVPEYQRLVVFRLGRVREAKGPGLVVLIPVVDRGVRVDLRERFFDVQPQTCITADNAPVSIDFLVYMKIVDALPSVLNVVHFEGAARGIALTTLRAVVGGMLLDDVLSKREEINAALRGKLDEVTSRWGLKVTAVEIREILPPRDIQDAMTRQMSAERSRRAMIAQADGRREATVRVAQGKKQAAVLRAEGQALALEKVFAVARTIDEKTLSLQYLEALKTVGTSDATKLVVPVELMGFVQPFVDHVARATGDGGRGEAARVARAA
jgi:regulator of protease activity HflC (stomatin/prohibitin superfamily)